MSFRYILESEPGLVALTLLVRSGAVRSVRLHRAGPVPVVRLLEWAFGFRDRFGSEDDWLLTSRGSIQLRIAELRRSFGLLLRSGTFKHKRSLCLANWALGRLSDTSGDGDGSQTYWVPPPEPSRRSLTEPATRRPRARERPPIDGGIASSSPPPTSASEQTRTKRLETGSIIRLRS